MNRFTKPFCMSYRRGVLWFRLFGGGLIIKDSKRAFLLFSERNGIGGLRIGRFHFKTLSWW